MSSGRFGYGNMDMCATTTWFLENDEYFFVRNIDYFGFTEYGMTRYFRFNDGYL